MSTFSSTYYAATTAKINRLKNLANKEHLGFYRRWFGRKTESIFL